MEESASGKEAKRQTPGNIPKLHGQPGQLRKLIHYTPKGFETNGQTFDTLHAAEQHVAKPR